MACFGVVLRPPDRGKALFAGNDHIIITAGTVDHQQISVLVSAAYDPHMTVTRVENKVSGERIVSRDGGAVAVLGGRTSTMADDVLSARGVIKHPINKAAAI